MVFFTQIDCDIFIKIICLVPMFSDRRYTTWSDLCKKYNFQNYWIVDELYEAIISDKKIISTRSAVFESSFRVKYQSNIDCTN